MTEINAAVIPAPLAHGPRYHLIFAHRAFAAENYIFIPEDPEPGLSIDLLRIDLIRVMRADVAGFLETWWTNFTRYAGEAEANRDVIDRTRKEIVVHASFSRHPVAGAQHTIAKFTARTGFLCVIQFLRKIEPLSREQVNERIEFVRAAAVDIAALQRQADSRSDFARRFAGFSSRLTALFGQIAATRSFDEPPERLMEILLHANPLDNPIEWANLAKLWAGEVLDKGDQPLFEKARLCLNLAALALDDARTIDPAVAVLDRAFHNTIAMLAEFLLYAVSGDRPGNAARASRLYQMAADHFRPSAPGEAALWDVLGGFAAALPTMTLSIPFRDVMGPRVGDLMSRPETLRHASETLMGISTRMAYVANRTGRDRQLYLGSGLAADICQYLIEQAIASGGFDEKAQYGELVPIFQRQLDAQLAIFGLTQRDLDHAARLTGTGSPSGERPRFVYLRPLCTARREFIRNEFPRHPRYALLPEEISIEAALHNALLPAFQTDTLGGPLDLFGMHRATVVGMGGDEWRGAATILIELADIIGVLWSESDGLAWELSEIARRGAKRKTMFIIAPGQRTGESAAVDRLRQIGFTLPDAPRDGCYLMDADGACEQVLPFDAVWSGGLRSQLFRAVAERGQRPSGG